MASILETAVRHEISGGSVPSQVMEAGDDAIVLPDGMSLATATFDRVGDSLSVTAPDGEQVIIRGYFDQADPPELVSPDGSRMSGDLAAQLAGPLAPGQVAQAGPALAAAPIGTVESIAGSVVAVRADGTRVELQAGDAVYQGDILESGDQGSLGIVLADDSSFSMGENGRMVLDEMVYDPGTQDGSLGLSVVQGVFTFFSGQIAKTNPDAMTIDTPVATIGIRGTQVGVSVTDDGIANIVLMEEADGFVGEIVVINDGGVTIMNVPFLSAVFTDFGAAHAAPRLMDEGELIDTFVVPLSYLPTTGNNANSYGLGSGDGLTEAALEDVAGFNDFETAAGGDAAPAPGAGAGADGPIQVVGGDYTGPAETITPVQGAQAPFGASGPAGSGPAGTSDGGGDTAAPFGPAEAASDGTVVRTVDGAYDGSGLSADQAITGGDGGDTIATGSGNDTLGGNAGDDILYAGAGNDAVDGGAGADTIVGGAGAGDDIYEGGDGSDTIVYASADSPVTVDLAAGTASGADIDDDILTGIENVVGGAGDDTISGDAADNRLAGAGGDDVLDGRGGSDTVVYGGNRADYEIAALEDGAFRITDTREGGDGTDIVTNVEFFEFADQTLTSGDLIPGEVIEGTNSGDTLTGGAGNDQITGRAGHDTIQGGAGDDDITGGAHNDTLSGGDGDDTFLVSGSGDGYDRFHGGDGNDRVVGSEGDDTIGLNGTFNADSSIEEIDGGAGTNVIRGTASGDRLDFSATTLTDIDEIQGGSGHDTITGSTGDDTIVGGAHNDTLTGGAGDDTIGLNGTFNADNSIEEIDGGAGTNVIRGTASGDRLDFSDTTLTNIDAIHGGSGHDTIIGSAGGDTIVGGAHNDTLSGGDGDDTFLVSGSGDGYDRFHGGDGTDRVVGGDGDDTIGLNGTFNAENSIEEIDGGAGTNVIRGTASGDRFDFADTTLTNIDAIHGGSGHDTIIGSAGGDMIDGGAHNDTLTGGAGDDVLIGGSGNDTMFGGEGDDTFVFDTGSGQDLIGDFGDGDALRFEGGEFSLENLQIEQAGDDTVITFDGVSGMRVTLNDVDAESLQGYTVSETESGDDAVVIAAGAFN